MARDRIERIRRGETPPEKHTAARPFCTIPSSIFTTRRMRALPGSAVRVLLWLEGGWHPERGAVLPQRRIATDLHLRPHTIGEATRALVDAGLIELRTPAIRPGAMGDGRRGEAAVYDLPHRRPGGTVRFDPGDQRLPGFVKFWATDARALAAKLTDRAARVLVIAIATPRDRNGSLQADSAPIDLTGERLADLLPGLDARTARRAVADLLDLGLIEEIRARAGSRAGRFLPAGLLVTRIARRSPRERSDDRVHGVVHGAAQMTGKPGARDGKLRVSEGAAPPGTAFPDKWEHANPVFRTNERTGKKLPGAERSAAEAELLAPPGVVPRAA